MKNRKGLKSNKPIKIKKPVLVSRMGVPHKPVYLEKLYQGVIELCPVCGLFEKIDKGLGDNCFPKTNDFYGMALRHEWFLIEKPQPL